MRGRRPLQPSQHDRMRAALAFFQLILGPDLDYAVRQKSAPGPPVAEYLGRDLGGVHQPVTY